MREDKLGRRYIMSDAHKQAIRLAKMGHKQSEETREKIREKRALQIVKPLTDDHKRKIGNKNAGNRNGMYGRKHSLDAIEKIRQAGINRHQQNKNQKKEGPL